MKDERGKGASAVAPIALWRDKDAYAGRRQKHEALFYEVVRIGTEKMSDTVKKRLHGIAGGANTSYSSVNIRDHLCSVGEKLIRILGTTQLAMR